MIVANVCAQAAFADVAFINAGEVPLPAHGRQLEQPDPKDYKREEVASAAVHFARLALNEVGAFPIKPCGHWCN